MHGRESLLSRNGNWRIFEVRASIVIENKATEGFEFFFNWTFWFINIWGIRNVGTYIVLANGKNIDYRSVRKSNDFFQDVDYEAKMAEETLRLNFSLTFIFRIDRTAAMTVIWNCYL